MSYTDEFKKIAPNCNYSTFTVKCFEQNLSEDDFLDLEPQHAEMMEVQKQLLYATFANNVALIKELLSSGVSVDITEYKKHFCSKFRYYLTPLQIATALGFQETLECLIHHGANVNCKDRYNVSPIHMATEQGHFECLQILLEAGAKCYPLSYYHRTYFDPAPFYNGTTPLHIAVTKKHDLCIKELMQYSADYNVADELGRTVLYIASEMGSEECVLTLLRNTAGCVILSLPGIESGDTPLHFAIRHAMLQSIKELLQQGSDVHCENFEGYSPMDICFKYLYSDPDVFFKILELIVLHGCNIDINLPIPGHLALSQNLIYSYHLTPLQHIIYSNIDRSTDFAKFLIGFGAKFSAQPTYNLDFLQFDFKNVLSDPIILKAILDSMCFPPRMDCLYLSSSNRKPPVSITGSGNFQRLCTNRNQVLRGHMKDCFTGTRNVQRLRTNRIQRLRGHMLHSYKISYPCVPSLQHLCWFTLSLSIGPKRLNSRRDFPVLNNKCVTYILLGGTEY